MKMHVLEIPYEPKERALWLEEQLVGLDLAAVVTELYALGEGEPLPEKTLEQVLGSSLGDVLEKGLTVLTPAQLRELICIPALLLQLQVQIFVEGGAYWHQRSQAVAEAGVSSEMSRHVETGRAKMRLFLQSQRPALLKPEPGRGGGGGGNGNIDGTGVVRMAWYRSPFFASLATAAVVLVGVYAVKPFTANAPQVAQGWGWSRPGALDETLAPKDYLTQLSEAAKDWHKKQPATPEALAKRILEFRRGCSTLILAEHKPLAPEDKAWLVERCQAWAKKLDQHLADIEAGKDVLEVRHQADETVNKLIKALADRAQKV